MLPLPPPYSFETGYARGSPEVLQVMLQLQKKTTYSYSIGIKQIDFQNTLRCCPHRVAVALAISGRRCGNPT